MKEQKTSQSNLEVEVELPLNIELGIIVLRAKAKPESIEAALTDYVERKHQLEPRTFQGKVVDIQLVDGFTDGRKQYNRYAKQLITEILSYDNECTPRTNTYTQGMYKVTAVDSQGNTRQFRHYGKPLQIGTQHEFKESILNLRK